MERAYTRIESDDVLSPQQIEFVRERMEVGVTPQLVANHLGITVRDLRERLRRQNLCWRVLPDGTRRLGHSRLVRVFEEIGPGVAGREAEAEAAMAGG